MAGIKIKYKRQPRHPRKSAYVIYLFLVFLQKAQSKKKQIGWLVWKLVFTRTPDEGAPIHARRSPPGPRIEIYELLKSSFVLWTKSECRVLIGREGAGSPRR